MSEIVIPPWNLGALDPDYDPYSLDVDVSRWWYRENLLMGWGLPTSVTFPEVEVRRVVDPNEKDGQWSELVFMPHWPATVYEDLWPPLRDCLPGGSVRIPEYMSVAQAVEQESRGKVRA